jgi:hypothetical protein
VREGTVLLRFNNYSANDLYLVTEDGARPLRVPDGPGARRPSDRGAGPGGGATAPRMHLIRRVGAHAYVATENDRLLRLDGDTLTPINVQPPLRWLATQSFEGDGVAAASDDGRSVLLLGSQPYLCRANDCQGLSGAGGAGRAAGAAGAGHANGSSGYGFVAHIDGPHFLLLSEGAAVWDTSL